MNKRTSDKEQHEHTRSPLAERLVALVGAVAVLYVTGFMFYQAWWGDDSAPDIEIAITRIVPVHGEYLVEISISNRGGSTAADATITGKLMPVREEEGSGPPSGSLQPLETAEVTVDYVPPHSRVLAGLYFEHKPTPEQLKLSAGGYVRP